MKQKLWLSHEGKVMIGDQELPRCRVISTKNDGISPEADVVFEVEVEKLDIKFNAIVLEDFEHRLHECNC